MTDHAGVMHVFVPLTFSVGFPVKMIFAFFLNSHLRHPPFTALWKPHQVFNRVFNFSTPCSVQIFPIRRFFHTDFHRVLKTRQLFPTFPLRQKPKMFFVQNAQKTLFSRNPAPDNRRMPKCCVVFCDENLLLFTNSSLFPDKNVIY